jgi:signal transduction histidine kinase
VWLATGEHLIASTSYPAVDDDGTPESAENLALLLARPGIGYVVPVLDGTELRAALSIEKAGLPITPADRRLMRDVAGGAALLLRTVALNAELADRVRRADHLAEELRASRRRLARAREVERRRLLTELSRATSVRLATLREHVAAARAGLGDQERQSAGAALVRACTEVDELLDRFRVIARGVYPAVLRGQGPGAALEELAADLRRPVRLTGDLGVRVAWEIESAVYQVTAAALDVLAAQPATGEIQVRLTRGGGRLRILVEDPSPPLTAGQVRAVLVDDIERLTALGGDVECADGGEPALRLLAWLPDRLEALLGFGEAA